MYVNILILALLLEQPRHGYEIRHQVESVLGSVVHLNNRQLYPTLRKFEELGAISRTVVPGAGKPDRHVYALTTVGRDLLDSQLRTFTPEHARDHVEFQVRVAYFHLIDQRTKLAILDAREAALRTWQAHVQRSRESALPLRGTFPYALDVIAYNQESLELELRWIAHLRQRITQEGGDDRKGEATP